MRNFKITIEYDGTHFCGWQVQGQNERTVQNEIASALSKIFKKKITLIGSGRTDSGVHALGQVANFKAGTSMSAKEVQKALNANLPEDIVITSAKEVELDFHAQYSAKSKIYRYTVLNRSFRSALSGRFSLHYPYPVNLNLMRKEAKALLGRKDFRSFQASDPERSERSTVRTMKVVRIAKKGDLFWVELEANGFLYKMVRNIVGTLLAVGSKRLPAGSVKKILAARNRKMAGQTAAAKGLCLVKVKY